MTANKDQSLFPSDGKPFPEEEVDFILIGAGKIILQTKYYSVEHLSSLFRPAPYGHHVHLHSPGDDITWEVPSHGQVILITNLQYPVSQGVRGQDT